MAITILILFLVFLTLGIPVFASLILSALIPFGMVEGIHAMEILAEIFYAKIANNLFASIIGFVFMAEIMLRTRVMVRLYDTLFSLLKRIPGSLGMTTIAFCMVFSAISGSSMATSVIVGRISIPQMLRFNYARRFAFGTVAAGGTLGILIPPSIALIVYGIIAEVSIGALFIAAIIPALLLVLLFSAYIFTKCAHDIQIDSESDVALDTPLRIYELAAILCLPLIIMGGIYGGIFSPNEAAFVSVFWALFIVTTGQEKFTLHDLLEAARNTAIICAKLFFIVGGAAFFAHVLVMLKLPDSMLQVLLALEIGKGTFLILVLLGILLLGMFMDGLAVTLITTPLLVPALQAFGFDLVWYGVVLVISLELSLITPPVGLNLFLIESITDARLEEIILGVLPFIAIMLVALMIVVTVPELSLWLPSLMLGR
ncbi:MAG: TRAP transporter large permease [Gammaproteobacteria bacterium]|nr:TRAP transporter large permease [Gammaproteobacteria bacterium]